MLVSAKKVQFVGICLKRRYPRRFPQAEWIKVLKKRSQSLQDAVNKQGSKANVAEHTAMLNSQAFSSVAEVLTKCENGQRPAGQVEGQGAEVCNEDEDFEHELAMCRAWASQMASLFHPWQMEAARVERSKVNKTLLGAGEQSSHLCWHGPNARFTSWFVLQCVLLSLELKNADHLQAVLKRSIMWLFPVKWRMRLCAQSRTCQCRTRLLCLDGGCRSIVPFSCCREPCFVSSLALQSRQCANLASTPTKQHCVISTCTA